MHLSEITKGLSVEKLYPWSMTAHKVIQMKHKKNASAKAVGNASL